MTKKQVAACFVVALASPLGFQLYNATLSLQLPESIAPAPRALAFGGLVLAGLWVLLIVAVPVYLLNRWGALRDAVERGAPAEHRRPIAGELRFAAIAVLVSWVALPLAYPAKSLRRLALAGVPSRAAPLIAAIDRYRSERGSYPPSLDEIVPGYLPKAPYTGLPVYPRFEYRLVADRRSGESYELMVRLLHGSGEVLLYWPEHRYPPTIDGRRIRPIGAWAHAEQ